MKYSTLLLIILLCAVFSQNLSASVKEYSTSVTTDTIKERTLLSTRLYSLEKVISLQQENKELSRKVS
ncbi:hypothetical protein D3C86_1361360 [compost metagenome]